MNDKEPKQPTSPTYKFTPGRTLEGVAWCALGLGFLRISRTPFDSPLEFLVLNFGAIIVGIVLLGLGVGAAFGSRVQGLVTGVVIALGVMGVLQLFSTS